MADIINLRQARKAMARQEAESTAAANRAKFGRTKAEKQRDAREATRLAADIEGAKRTPTERDI